MSGLPSGGSGEAANSARVRARLEEMFASGAMPRETMDFRSAPHDALPRMLQWPRIL
jgi:hypothetical protein